MRGPFLVLSVVGACGFSPSVNFEPVDAPYGRDAVHDMPVDAMGSGSGNGSAVDCPSGDDDSDGECNGMDDWPCGAKPGSPGNFHIVGFEYDYQDNNVMIAGQNRLAVVEPGAAFTLDFDYSITIPCQNGQMCHLVIETGTQAGKQNCGAEANVTGVRVLLLEFGSTLGHAHSTLNIGTPGLYRILTDGSPAPACGSNWIQGSPSNDFTLGFVCVHHQM